MPPTEQLTAARPRLTAPALPRIAVRHAVAAGVLALAALSLLAPSAPTYDPWSWIIWGREVVHLDLSTTNGPSWKPLPVLLTTPFALFGPIAPDLWLLVARAGAIAGVVFAFRLARRLDAGVIGAGAAAAAYAFAPWTIRNAALGNSEGLLVALLLAAAERHLAGSRRAAFALGVGAALLRPEAWALIGLYGLWLVWSERRTLRLVAAGFVSLPLLWLLPELWGSGDLLRAAGRARRPNANSAAFADNPAAEVLRSFATLTTPAVWVGLAALVATLVAARAVSRRRTGAVLALAGAAGIWVAEVAVMTSDGFSGNARYLIAPAAVACVLSGTGLGWGLRAVAGERIAGTLAVALAAVAALAFAAPSLPRLAPTLRAVGYQARLTDALGPTLARAGGRERVLACARPFTGPFQVPAVAWQLRVHIGEVGMIPEPGGTGVAFRARTTSRSRAQPTLAALRDGAAAPTLAAGARWRIVGRCR